MKITFSQKGKSLVPSVRGEVPSSPSASPVTPHPVGLLAWGASPWGWPREWVQEVCGCKHGLWGWILAVPPSLGLEMVPGVPYTVHSLCITQELGTQPGLIAQLSSGQHLSPSPAQDLPAQG